MAALFAFVALCLVSGGALTFLARLNNQTKYDNNRKTYRLIFPAEMSSEHVALWLHSVSGTLKSKNILAGQPSIVFEMWATEDGIMHRIKVPYQYPGILKNLLSSIPGIRHTPEDEWPERRWKRAVELGLSHSVGQLDIPSPDKLSKDILTNVQPLRGPETVIMQWVVTPARKSALPTFEEGENRDEVKDRREKLGETNYLAVVRIASTAETDIRASFLVNEIRSALASAETYALKFKHRLMSPEKVRTRIDQAIAPIDWPMKLSATELASVLGWPIGSPNIIGLPQYASRVLPPAQTVPSTGLVIGHSSYPGMERKVAIGFQEALMHTHVLGKTGVGKSVLLAHMAKQIMEAGYGVILIETEGNLYQSVLDYIPKERADEVVLLDVSDTQHPVGFNVLDQSDSVVDQIIDLFVHKFGKDGMGIWAQEYIYHGLRTLAATPNTSFTDLAALLLPRTPEEIDWVESVTRNLKDPELRRWWQRHDNRERKEQQQRADPVLSRIWQLASRPELRYILGQSSSTFKVADVLKNNGILLVNLKGVSRETASLAGTLIMNAIWHNIKGTVKEKPTYIILDEFADFMDLPIDTESMLAQARKHQVGMILANQHMGQLKPSVREAIISNARNKVVFQTNSDDARLIGREFGPQVGEGDFTRLQAYEALAQVQTLRGTSNPITIQTIAPSRKSGNAGEAIYRSRQKYSRPLEDVVRDVESRHQSKAAGKRPQIGGLPNNPTQNL